MDRFDPYLAHLLEVIPKQEAQEVKTQDRFIWQLYQNIDRFEPYSAQLLEMIPKHHVQNFNQIGLELRPLEAQEVKTQDRFIWQLYQNMDRFEPYLAQLLEVITKHQVQNFRVIGCELRPLEAQEVKIPDRFIWQLYQIMFRFVPHLAQLLKVITKHLSEISAISDENCALYWLKKSRSKIGLYGSYIKTWTDLNRT